MNSWKKLLIIIPLGIVFLGLLGTAGYFFALRKTQPVYISKIDQLMFDTKNKPPKFLLTLPDNERLEKIKVEDLRFDDKKKDLPLEALEVLKDIPLISKLMPWENKEPLKVLDKADVKKPWSYYAKKVDAPQNFYKVAVVIRGLGVNSQVTQKVIESTPGRISLSFSPYTKEIEKSIKKARESGHETYMDMLMPSKDFLKSDNGPKALSITKSIDENIKVLENNLAVNAAIGGVVVSRGIADKDAIPRLTKVVNFLKEKGLLMLDASGEEGFRAIDTTDFARDEAEVIIDADYSKKAIATKFAQAEEIALKNGHVVVVIDPKPIAVFELIKWIKTFSKPQKSYDEIKGKTIEKPFILVPLSSVVVE